MKRFIALSFLALGVSAEAQTIGNSPYAAFGIGDPKYDNTIETSSMGGITTAYVSDFSNSFNFRNPAANAHFDLTSFRLEATNENNFYKSDYQNTKVTQHSNYLSNISLAFPISSKMKFGIGYQPYSSKAYDILISKTQTNGSSKTNRFHGQGTLSTVQAALGYKISEAFAVGFRSNFYFGKLNDTEEVTFSNADLINGYDTQSKIKSFNFTAGTTYRKLLKNDRHLTLGATYTFGTTGNLVSEYTNSTYYYSSIDQKANESVIEQTKNESKNLIPQEFSFGMGYGKDGKWFYGSQLDYRKGENISFLGQPFEYQDAYRISAGGWYLPNYNNFRNYFSRVIYRFGAYYEKGNLKLNPAGAATGTDVNKFALTAGMMLPFANSSINRINGLDVGLEVGKRGTLQNNMISQTFVNFKVGINFADKWFQKRQYD
ncbi:hypothetical protein [Bergeyella sp. RCAD1439]|uniref:hypothetical protein n=1 Tax=Bergeyella anatis TaxID=3113737 RepID=UPI002E16E330|nr:hypothetical protein [Bergeyella sp. RCAD1439]